VRTDRKQSTPRCDDDSEQTDLYVYLVSDLRGPFHLSQECAGIFHYPGGERGSHNGLCWLSRVRALASSISFRAEELLGLVMAHELDMCC